MKTGQVVLLAAVGAILGAVADHFLEVPVKAFAAKFWGKVHPLNPSTTAGPKGGAK